MLVAASATSGTRHQVTACIALGRPLFVHASLLGQGIEWLDAAQERGQLSVWRTPLDVFPRLPALVAK